MQVLGVVVMRKIIFFVVMVLCLQLYPMHILADTGTGSQHPIHALINEQLAYDISFLWFDRLAEGSIELTQGPVDGTFLVTMQARTLGVAAFFTRNRVEKFQTLMRIEGDGLLHPLWHSSHTIRDKQGRRTEKVTKYTFDYSSQRVRYQKIKNGKAYADQWFDMKDDPLFDILSALYNMRLGFFGSVGEKRILIPTFHRKGPQDIIVDPLLKKSRKDQRFFAGDPVQTRILVDPSVFGTKGRDILASFDSLMRPQKGIIKNVIGLGDVRGVLRSSARNTGG